MNIREEKSKDYHKIYDFVKEAFLTAKVTDGIEQEYVNALRKSNKYIPSLALILEKNSDIIGYIMFTKLYLKESKEEGFLLLAPLAVKKEFRSQKFGEALVKAGFKRARALGYKAVFLVGDPCYYSRFGFKSSKEYNISNTNDIPYEFCLAFELTKGALKGISGEIDYMEDYHL